MSLGLPTFVRSTTLLNSLRTKNCHYNTDTIDAACGEKIQVCGQYLSVCGYILTQPRVEALHRSYRYKGIGTSFNYRVSRFVLPLLVNAEQIIRTSLLALSQNKKPPVVAIATFTIKQFEDINAVRRGLKLHELESNEILFLGRHLFNSRSDDGYTINDIFLQIESSLSEHSLAVINIKMASIQAVARRDDGYGNAVLDRAIFEMTQRRPKAELFSVIPKGDRNKPQNAKSPPAGEPFTKLILGN